MELKNKMEKFNKRWNITSTDSHKEAFNKFKRRILNILENIDHHVKKEGIEKFCQYYGIEKIWQKDSFALNENIIKRLRAEKAEEEFYRLIEIIFSLDITINMVDADDFGLVYHDDNYRKKILLKKTIEAIELSDINLSIAVLNNDEVILYPKGEEKLDDELVNYVLSFLDGKSDEHFKDALKFNQEKKYIKSAESLRRALEEFLKSKLKNTKGLKNNIIELGAKLKSDGRNPQIRNIISQLFSYLDEYFNKNSKHEDGDIDSLENEYLIYQIALLIRYLNKK